MIELPVALLIGGLPILAKHDLAVDYALLCDVAGGFQCFAVEESVGADIHD